MEEWVPSKQIEIVLNREFVTPFINSIRKDPDISLKLSTAFFLLMISERLIVELDKNIKTDETHEDCREKTLFLGYLGKLYQSALLLIGATDYVGAMILLRSVFELLVGIATKENGSMRKRIISIELLDDDEKSRLQVLWNELSAWAHPYGKWLKKICPWYYGFGRNHYPVIFSECLEYSDQVLDFLLTITLDQFKINPERYADEYRKIVKTEVIEETSFRMFGKRLTK